MADAITAELVRRYERKVFDDEDTTYDVSYVDRLTGQIVLSYDGADPANTNRAYGGLSDSEYFERLGLDIDEGVERDKCHVPVPASEVAIYARETAANTRREKEEAEARDLNDVIPEAMQHISFSSSNYQAEESSVIAPALEAAGYSGVSFYHLDQDSFGPLVRGVRARDKEGNRVRFYYG